jgi:DNA-binding transcriptional regulator YhcF (GntR family)
MILRLDHDSPVPLYHQIAEAIRYRISTGDLKTGAALPPLRTAAELWAVNLHTVRKAYAALADIGMVRIRRPARATVVGRPNESGRKTAEGVRLQRFLEKVVGDAKARHGLSPFQLARLLTVQPRSSGFCRVAVVECSETQCNDLAAQLVRRWGIQAEPWCLTRQDDLPDGEIVATYFHYNDIRRRFPQRLAKIHFIAIRPDETLPKRITALQRDRRPREILVCEREPIMLSMIVSDLSTLLPRERFRLTPHLLKNPAALPAGRDSRLRLVAPRIWGSLSDEQRADPRIMEIRYVFDQVQIDRLAEELHWPERIQQKEMSA